jgi:type I restriction-modification system DNA methylase subunit
MDQSDIATKLGQQARRAIGAFIRSLEDGDHARLLKRIPESAVYNAAVTFAMRQFVSAWADDGGLKPPDDTKLDRLASSRHMIFQGHRLLVENEIALQLLRSLRYVKRRGELQRIDFRSFDVELIGRVYEALLDYTFGRDSRDHLCLVKGHARTTSGAHYTPRCLTERTVQYALEPLVYFGAAEGKPRDKWKVRSADELLALKVCDIACGSGAFLMQTCRYLSEKLVEAWNAAPDDGTLPRDDGERLIHARRLVASHCLYGVDLDPTAVEIAQLSLWLFTNASDEPLRFLNHRVRCGDSLFERSVEGLKVERPFNWQTEFPAVFSDRGGFDAIVGNPPYISLYARESQSANFTGTFNSYAKQQFGRIDGTQVIAGRVNTYLLFLVRSLQLVNSERGIASLVLPDTLLTNRSYEPMRRALTNSERLMNVVRFQDTQFRSATVGTAIVVCGPPGCAHRVCLTDESKDSSSPNVVRVPAASIAMRAMCSWLPQRTSHIARVTLPIRGTIPIEEFAFVKDGINPGSMQTREWLLTDVPDGDPSLRLCMEGNWIAPFCITRKDLGVRYDA